MRLGFLVVVVVVVFLVDVVVVFFAAVVVAEAGVGDAKTSSMSTSIRL